MGLTRSEFTIYSQRFLGTEVQVLSQEVNAMADAVAERNAALSERAQALDDLSERLQKVLDNIPIGIILLHESSVEMCNPVAKEQWNIQAHSPVPEFLDRPSGTYRELELTRPFYDGHYPIWGQRSAH